MCCRVLAQEEDWLKRSIGSMIAAIWEDSVRWLRHCATEHSENVPADLRRIDSMEETAVAAAGSAADDSEEDSTPEWASQELSPEKKMVYSIVNEFLGNITFNNPEAEALLEAVLREESCLTASTLARVVKVFSPIFCYYPKGLQDRSVWEPRDVSQYIAEWYRLASMRSRFQHATENSGQLSKQQVAEIFKGYVAAMNTNMRPDQRIKQCSYYNCANAKLRNEAGSTGLAKAIWAIGLPRLPPLATEQQEQRLSVRDLEAVPEAIHSVLKWLHRLATALTEQRAAIRRAKRDIGTAKDLAWQWENYILTARNWQRWQENLLRAYWSGLLHRRLEEVSDMP